MCLAKRLHNMKIIEKHKVIKNNSLYILCMQHDSISFTFLSEGTKELKKKGSRDANVNALC